VSAIVSGLAAGIIASIVCAVAERRRKAVVVDCFGWRTLRPGRLMIATIVGCCAMAALPAYILATGGSTRPDADTQNIFAALLAVGFGYAAFYASRSAFAQHISWNDRTLRIARSSGPVKEHRLDDAVSIELGEWSGLHCVRFNDESTVRFSSQLRGARELSSLIADLTNDQKRKRPASQSATNRP
jgi:hypothetical protein